MRRLSALLLSAVLFAGALSLASLARPETASAQTDAQRTRARAAYTEGQRRFDAGDFAGALTKFEEAYSIVSNPVVLLGVASAQERLGRTADARATLERYLRERPDAPDRADVEGRITAMGGSTVPVTTEGTLVITSEPAGAAVVVDGESSGAVTPTEVTVAPGDHEVALALSGYELSTESVTVAAGARAEVSVALTVMPEADAMSADEAFADDEEEEATEEEEPAPESGPSAATWVTTAIAGVALITGTVFGFVALSRQSDFDVTPTASLADEGEGFALAADLSFGVAIAAGITAIVLYATDRPSPEASTESSDDEESAALSPSVMFAPIVSPTGGGVAAFVTF